MASGMGRQSFPSPFRIDLEARQMMQSLLALEAICLSQPAEHPYESKLLVCVRCHSSQTNFAAGKCVEQNISANTDEECSST